ncbi:hypothetical protein F5X96DRAFT_666412 [Biscogniauxia mediterranea]|nr:hypothetical protein F5X96DRAFT_666412 [Biscogniauxia mediterranea]
MARLHTGSEIRTRGLRGRILRRKLSGAGHSLHRDGGQGHMAMATARPPSGTARWTARGKFAGIEPDIRWSEFDHDMIFEEGEETFKE